MNPRVTSLAVIGIACMPWAYIGFRSAFARIMMPPDWPESVIETDEGMRDRDGMAPVFFCDLKPDPGAEEVSFSMGEGGNAKALQIEVLDGQAFVADRLVPLDGVTNYVNEAHSDFVIIMPVKGSRWNGIFPILDACRKSKASRVFLNKLPFI
jgi:hypothetical protein